MKHYLLIDRGNTSAKAAIYDECGYVTCRTHTDPRSAVDEVLRACPSVSGVSEAVFCTVGQGGDAALAFLEDYAPRVTAVHGDSRLPIFIKPHHRATLGADRIAAAVGAYAKYGGRPLLVVDSGTAVTYDLVSADGTFEGGNIAPGLRLGLDALHRHTALLPQVAVPRRAPESLFGDDTESAMTAGVVYGVVGAVEALSRRLGDETMVVLTGGDAPLLLPLLEVKAEYAPHLVLDGLFALCNHDDFA